MKEISKTEVQVISGGSLFEASSMSSAFLTIGKTTNIVCTAVALYVAYKVIDEVTHLFIER